MPARSPALALALALPLVACREPAPKAARDAEVITASPAGEAAAASADPIKPEVFDVPAIDAYVAAQVEKKGLCGLALAIVRGGEIVLARGYGRRLCGADTGAGAGAGAAVDVDTAFAIGSVTKQFTCAAAMLLAAEGKLSLADPVAKFYPGLTRAAEITLDDLLSHRSGYPDYYPLDFVDARMQAPIDPDALIERYAGGPLDFEPRSRWSYSNTGFVIVGRVIEAISGEPLAAFLHRRLFEPAGMRHTSFAPTADTPGLAAGHRVFALGEPRPTAPEGAGWVHAAGAIYASASDLARWDLALMDGTILGADGLRELSSPRTLADGERSDYGCGVAVSRRQGETVVAHGGAVSGFLAHNAMIPRTRSAVILLSNTEGVDIGGLHGELLGLLIDADKPRPTIDGPPPVTVARALFAQMQAGVIERGALGEAFDRHLDPALVAEAAPRLRALGEPTAVKVERLGERGGMEVAVLRFAFAESEARALLYRTPDGKIQEFLLVRE